MLGAKALLETMAHTKRKTFHLSREKYGKKRGFFHLKAVTKDQDRCLGGVLTALISKRFAVAVVQYLTSGAGEIRQWINRFIVDTHFVVQMWSGRTAG